MSTLSDVPNYAALIHGQNIYTADLFTLESGVVLRQVPIAYKTWGILNERRDNVMVICHAFTGSSDVEDWYDSSMRIQKWLQLTRHFTGGGPSWESTRRLTLHDI